MTETHTIQAPPAPPAPTPDQAVAKLAELQNDKNWTGKFLSGNGPEVAEFRSLTEIAIKSGDRIDKAIAGVLDDAPIQQSGHMMNIAAAEMFRDLGIRDEVIREALMGKPVTQAEYDAVARLKAERMRDHAWVKEYMAGNGQHKRDAMLMDIVLTSPIKKEAAA